MTAQASTYQGRPVREVRITEGENSRWFSLCLRCRLEILAARGIDLMAYHHRTEEDGTMVYYTYAT